MENFGNPRSMPAGAHMVESYERDTMTRTMVRRRDVPFFALDPGDPGNVVPDAT